MDERELIAAAERIASAGAVPRTPWEALERCARMFVDGMWGIQCALLDLSRQLRTMLEGPR